MARPRKQVETLEVLRLRLDGISWPCIARRMRLGLGTVYRAYRTAIDSLQPFQNPKTARIQRGRRVGAAKEAEKGDAHGVYAVHAGIEESTR